MACLFIEPRRAVGWGEGPTEGMCKCGSEGSEGSHAKWGLVAVGVLPVDRIGHVAGSVDPRDRGHRGARNGVDVALAVFAYGAKELGVGRVA